MKGLELAVVTAIFCSTYATAHPIARHQLQATAMSGSVSCGPDGLAEMDLTFEKIEGPTLLPCGDVEFDERYLVSGQVQVKRRDGSVEAHRLNHVCVRNTKGNEAFITLWALYTTDGTRIYRVITEGTLYSMGETRRYLGAIHGRAGFILEQSRQNMSSYFWKD